MELETTDQITDINFTIPASELNDAFHGVRKLDYQIKNGGYSLSVRLFLSTYDKISTNKLLDGVTSLKELFEKLGFTTETDAAHNLKLVGYTDLTSSLEEALVVSRTLRVVAPHVAKDSYINWLNSKGDSWTSFFNGETLVIINEVVADDTDDED